MSKFKRNKFLSLKSLDLWLNKRPQRTKLLLLSLLTTTTHRFPLDDLRPSLPAVLLCVTHGSSCWEYWEQSCFQMAFMLPSLFWVYGRGSWDILQSHLTLLAWCTGRDPLRMKPVQVQMCVSEHVGVYVCLCVWNMLWCGLSSYSLIQMPVCSRKGEPVYTDHKVRQRGRGTTRSLRSLGE